MVGEVISTRVKLSFSQAQNFIADIALERNYTYYFWCVGHGMVGMCHQHHCVGSSIGVPSMQGPR